MLVSHTSLVDLTVTVTTERKELLDTVVVTSAAAEVLVGENLFDHSTYNRFRLEGRNLRVNSNVNEWWLRLRRANGTDETSDYCYLTHYSDSSSTNWAYHAGVSGQSYGLVRGQLNNDVNRPVNFDMDIHDLEGSSKYLYWRQWGGTQAGTFHFFLATGGITNADAVFINDGERIQGINLSSNGGSWVSGTWRLYGLRDE